MRFETCICFLNYTFAFQNTNIPGRDYADTDDTASTDPDRTFGGLGKFEYSSKVLPHALLHMTELVMRGGHHAAFCTFLAEVSHKYNVKIAAKLARTYGSHNVSQNKMLDLVLTHEVYEEAIALSAATAVQQDNDVDPNPGTVDDVDPGTVDDVDAGIDTSDASSHVSSEDDDVKRTATDKLFYFEDWSRVSNISVVWQGSFLSKRVRVTRGEVLNLTCSMLKIELTDVNRTRVLRELEWQAFGSMIEQDCGTLKRKFVGICKESPRRRDFVRMKCNDEHTCWAAEILMFIEISGFQSSGDSGLVLPKSCRTSRRIKNRILVALIRWLSPHPDALLRDGQRRPICPPPLDLNHVLWKYTEDRRVLVTQAIINRHLACYPGSTIADRVESSRLERNAKFDFVLPQSFIKFMNCTRVNVGTEDNVVLETVNIPF